MATPDAMAERRLIDAWQFDSDPDHSDTATCCGVFHTDGTYVMYTIGAGTSGIWEPTGERTADMMVF